MDKLKQFVALAVLASLGVLAAGWVLLISPKKSEAATTREQAVQQVAGNQQLEIQLKQLQAQAKDLPKKQADIARVAAKIPDNPSLPSLIRAVTAASVASGVEFISITPSAPEAAAPAPTAAVTAPAPPPASAQTTAGAVPAGATGQLYSIPVDLEVVGSYLDIAQFVAGLEDMPRAVRVTNLALAPGVSASAKDAPESTKAKDGSSLVLTLTGEVFMATNRPAATAVVVPGQTAPAAPVAASVPTGPAS